MILVSIIVGVYRLILLMWKFYEGIERKTEGVDAVYIVLYNFFFIIPPFFY